MWIQEKHSTSDKRRTEKIGKGGILFIQEYNRSDGSATLYKELENIKRGYWENTTYSDVLNPIQCRSTVPNTFKHITGFIIVKGRTILSVRKHLEECNGKIHLDTKYVQHPLREHDVSINHLDNTQIIHKVIVNQKEKINCVRIFLGVHYVSEICMVDRTSFVPGILERDDSQLCY